MSDPKNWRAALVRMPDACTFGINLECMSLRAQLDPPTRGECNQRETRDCYTWATVEIAAGEFSRAVADVAFACAQTGQYCEHIAEFKAYEASASRCQEKGGVEACFDLSQRLFAPYPAGSMRWSKRACDLGHKFSCERVATFAAHMKRVDTCRKGTAEDCLASALQGGTVWAENVLQGLCAEGLAGACNRLLGDVRTGRAPRLAAKKQELVQSACSAGSGSACTILATQGTAQAVFTLGPLVFGCLLAFCLAKSPGRSVKLAALGLVASIPLSIVIYILAEAMDVAIIGDVYEHKPHFGNVLTLVQYVASVAVMCAGGAASAPLLRPEAARR